MTILSTFQGASAQIAIAEPSVVFSSTDREHFELRVLANAAADYIAKDYEWRQLKMLATIDGDDVTEAFTPPSDYDRMMKSTRLWSSTYQTPLTHITDTDRWLELDIRQYSVVVGVWTMIGEQVHIKPAPVTGQTVQYYYMSKKWAVAADAITFKTAFDNDTDSFRLSEELLRLCIIWKWKAQKKLPYAQEQDDYENAKEKLILADKGARMISVGRTRHRGIADSIAYPVPIEVP